MQASGESDPDACQYNDLALVQLSAADAAKVNPSVPFFGGPTGLRSGAGMTHWHQGAVLRQLDPARRASRS